ncbi:MAG: poly-gamma-glutamate biosynthesis protein PgsC/CapC [Acidimicrobiales bacterium]
MRDYLFPIEVVRFAFVVGVVVSMLLYERRHLTTGSIVVPGYVAVFLLLPSALLATVVNAAVTYVLVNKVLMRWFLLYGRTKFTILAAISISLQTVMLELSPSGPWLWERDVPYFVGVGYVVPALIAHDMARQGIVKTAKSVLLASGLVAGPILLAVVLRLPDVTQLAPFRPIAHAHLPATWIPLAILLSAVAAWGVAHNHDLRAGGFVGSALLAVFAVNPWQVLAIIGVAVLTHQLVTRVLMTRLILFGRRKFASMLMLSSAIVWVTVWSGQHLFPVGLQEHLGISSLALTPLFLPGLLANDMHRSSVSRVLVGVALASTFVLTMTLTIRTIALGQPRAVAPTVVAAITAAAILGPQVYAAIRAGLGALRAPFTRVGGWLRPELGPFVAATPLALVTPIESSVAAPIMTVHTARALGLRDPMPRPAESDTWLAGRRRAEGLTQAPVKPLAWPSGYQPRHLAPPPGADRAGPRASVVR